MSLQHEYDHSAEKFFSNRYPPFDASNSKYAAEHALIDKALEAAKAAAKAELAKWGNRDVGACGFGWVEINPARGRLISAMKERDMGSKHWKRGWTVWDPSQWAGQNIDVKERAAYAFAKVLNDAGYNATGCSRMD